VEVVMGAKKSEELKQKLDEIIRKNKERNRTLAKILRELKDDSKWNDS
jgi:hypothetical protein